MSANNYGAFPPEDPVTTFAARWNLPEELAERRWQRESASSTSTRHTDRDSKGRHTLDSAPIVFTAGEVSTYYAARVPRFNPGRAGQGRGPCPLHDGQDDNFVVNLETGEWFCHSRCGRGGGILTLEQELTGADFKTAKDTVFRIVGRIESKGQYNHTNGNPAGAAHSRRVRPNRGTKQWREIARYPYVNRDGNLLYETVRYLKPDGKKTFTQVRPSGIEAVGTGGVPTGGIVLGLTDGKYVPDPEATRATGKTTWKKAENDVEYGGAERHFGECPRVPYRLPKVLEADTIYLPEGEADVHTLESFGLVASCNAGGCGGGLHYSGWKEEFRDRHIIILPDNDEPGKKHATTKAETLLSCAASIRIVELPGLPEKGDVSDWCDAGGTFEQFRQLVDSAAPLDAAGLSELGARWGLTDGEPHHYRAAEDADEWPKPDAIQSELPPVQAFSEQLLPNSFRPLVTDVMERMQVPIDFPAVMTMLCLAGVVNRRATIQPKANDTGWKIVPNLWGGIIAPPGFMKSPVIQAVTRPLNLIQADWRREEEEALKDYACEKEEFELRHAAWKEQYKAASKRGSTIPDRPEDLPEEPKCRRLIVNDSTFEALHQTMSENPAGILVIRDELTGWWSQLDRPGREGERAFCLQAWNGDTGHTIDRIGRGTIHVEACCMSMLGGIQPGRLRSYLVDALHDGPTNDGLIQRFQLLVWPDLPRDWVNVDRAPNAAAEERLARVIRKLLELNPQNPALFRFSPDAQELFNEWLAELETQLRGNELHPALISHLSKYRSLMPSLALLFELADRAGFEGFEGSSLANSENFVSLEHAQQAAAMCDYLTSHARRVYSCVVSPQLRAARELAEHLRKKHVRNKEGGFDWFVARDVYLKGWSGLDSPDAVRSAARILQDAGWLREVFGGSGPSGGRPSDKYEVNPGVWV